MNAITLPFPNHKVSASQAILYGGLMAGVLDATDGVIAYGLQGLNPIQVLQYIASGLIGQSSFSGGLATAALGTLLHFFIAFVAAAVYVVASRKLPALNHQATLFGLLYGVAVYVFMNYGVLPHSAVAPSSPSLPMLLNGFVGHALFVGLPIATFVAKVSE